MPTPTVVTTSRSIILRLKATDEKLKDAQGNLVGDFAGSAITNQVGAPVLLRTAGESEVPTVPYKTIKLSFTDPIVANSTIPPYPLLVLQMLTSPPAFANNPVTAVTVSDGNIILTVTNYILTTTQDLVWVGYTEPVTASQRPKDAAGLSVADGFGLGSSAAAPVTNAELINLVSTPVLSSAANTAAVSGTFLLTFNKSLLFGAVPHPSRI